MKLLRSESALDPGSCEARLFSLVNDNDSRLVGSSDAYGSQRGLRRGSESQRSNRPRPHGLAAKRNRFTSRRIVARSDVSEPELFSDVDPSIRVARDLLDDRIGGFGTGPGEYPGDDPFDPLCRSASLLVHALVPVNRALHLLGLVAERHECTAVLVRTGIGEEGEHDETEFSRLSDLGSEDPEPVEAFGRVAIGNTAEEIEL